MIDHVYSLLIQARDRATAANSWDYKRDWMNLFDIAAKLYAEDPSIGKTVEFQATVGLAYSYFYRPLEEEG